MSALPMMTSRHIAVARGDNDAPCGLKRWCKVVTFRTNNIYDYVDHSHTGPVVQEFVISHWLQSPPPNTLSSSHAIPKPGIFIIPRQVDRY